LTFDFGFTARDTELLGGSRYADPLGLGPVWANLARRVVPNLTNQTHRGEGFQLLICGVDLYERHVEASGGNSALPFRDFYIVLEQAFAHSTFRYGKSRRWNLPGSRAVKAASGHVKIGLEHQLLNAQFGGGTWGLYAAAADRSGLVSMETTHDRQPSARLREHVRTQIRRGYGSRSVVSKLDDLFRGIRKGVKGSYAITKAEWAKSLASIIERLPHRELLRHAIIDQPRYATPPGFPRAHTALLAEVARRLRSKYQEWSEQEEPRRNFYRDFVEDCAATTWDSEKFGEAQKIFGDILVAESFLAPLAELFDALFAHRGKSPTRITDDLEIPFQDLAHAREAFIRLSYWSETASRRAALYGGLDCSSGPKVIESVVAIHSEVARDRGRHPWLLNESGVITPLVDQELLQQPQLSPTEAWRNSYYLQSLHSLAEQFDVH